MVIIKSIIANIEVIIINTDRENELARRQLEYSITSR